LEYVHDLGTVLAHGQTLRHEFKVHNSSNVPLRILAAEALTPCCSSLESVQEFVPPGGDIQVPVMFRPGLQSGRKQVQFSLRTDAVERAVLVYRLVATLVAEVEVELLEGSDTRLLLGESGKQVFRVTCRRVAGTGRGAVLGVEASGGLAARFVEAGYTRTMDDGTVESTRELEVALPPESEVGQKAGALVLRWPDAFIREQPIGWRVTPCIEATPAALILKETTGEPIERTILLRSLNGPFRVLGVAGNLQETTFSSESATSHRLRLTLSPVAPGRGNEWNAATDVQIKTDHPDQPTVSVTILRIEGTP
jgi:hypothetical protein